MLKRDDPKSAREARELAAQCHLMLDFFEERSDHAYKRILSIKRQGIARALTQAHVAGLKMAYRDLREDVDELSPGDRAELLHTLQTVFGTDVSSEIKDEIARAHGIVRSGKISDLDEYALLRAFLEHHLERGGTPALVERATRLVADFERNL